MGCSVSCKLNKSIVLVLDSVLYNIFFSICSDVISIFAFKIIKCNRFVGVWEASCKCLLTIMWCNIMNKNKSTQTSQNRSEDLIGGWRLIVLVILWKKFILSFRPFAIPFEDHLNVTESVISGSLEILHQLTWSRW